MPLVWLQLILVFLHSQLAQLIVDFSLKVQVLVYSIIPTRFESSMEMKRSLKSINDTFGLKVRLVDYRTHEVLAEIRCSTFSEFESMPYIGINSGRCIVEYYTSDNHRFDIKTGEIFNRKVEI